MRNFNYMFSKIADKDCTIKLYASRYDLNVKDNTALVISEEHI